MPGIRLSVVIITKDEAENMRECLSSVAWADEIIVVDSGSTDETVAICREYTPHVLVHADWQGFGIQKNRALDHAHGEWVLSLDADERVSADLRREIEDALARRHACIAFQIPRLSSYLGRKIRHGGWWPDYVTRLFRRGQARFSADLVHERLVVDGPVGRLGSPLLHESFRTLDQVLDKLNRYSRAGAERMLAEGARSGLGRAVMRGLWTFVRCYLLRAGFLDGREGFLLAVSNAEGAYYRYLKLLYLQRSRCGGH